MRRGEQVIGPRFHHSGFDRILLNVTFACVKFLKVQNLRLVKAPLPNAGLAFEPEGEPAFSSDTSGDGVRRTYR